MLFFFWRGTCLQAVSYVGIDPVSTCSTLVIFQCGHCLSRVQCETKVCLISLLLEVTW